MHKPTKEDIAFLDEFLASDELTEERLIELEQRLKNPAFKSYYKRRINEHYARTPVRRFTAYLPMIIMILLTLVGGYLILNYLI